MRIFESADAFAAAAGEVLGTTDWVTVAQHNIDLFADATGDHQWIHVDPERAATGPFGGTIAHGFLTLSMLPVLMGSLYRVDGVKLAVNYGLNKVRFPAPLPAGKQIRGTTRIDEVELLTGAVQGVLTTTIEVEGGDRPVCVAQSIVRYFV